jgi:RNA polymerase-binding transcription factor
MYNAAVILLPSGLEQMAARKKTSRKKTTAKARKTAAKKTASKKKVARKAAKKKSAVGKKTSKKKTARKVSKKKVVRKKVSSKKTARVKASKKKVANKPSTTRISKSKVTTKTATKAAGKTRATRKTSPKRKNVNADNLIHGIQPYKEKKGEDFMNEAQLEHFRQILQAWKQELMQEVDRTVHHMQDEASNFPDPNDRATQESEFGLELRTRDRERKLLKKIAQAITRIDDESYGFCEETGEEIGLQRLEARPVATLSVEAQERRELAERQYSDGDD